MGPSGVMAAFGQNFLNNRSVQRVPGQSKKLSENKKSAIVVTALPLLIFSFALHECLSKYELLLKGSGLFH